MWRIISAVAGVYFFCLAQLASANLCTKEALQGTWTRQNTSDLTEEEKLALPTEWTFLKDGTLQCTGDCNRRSGTPLTWSMETRKGMPIAPGISSAASEDGRIAIVTITFSKGSRTIGYCDLNANTLALISDKNKEDGQPYFFFRRGQSQESGPSLAKIARFLTDRIAGSTALRSSYFHKGGGSGSLSSDQYDFVKFAVSGCGVQLVKSIKSVSAIRASGTTIKLGDVIETETLSFDFNELVPSSLRLNYSKPSEDSQAGSEVYFVKLYFSHPVVVMTDETKKSVTQYNIEVEVADTGFQLVEAFKQAALLCERQ